MNESSKGGLFLVSIIIITTYNLAIFLGYHPAILFDVIIEELSLTEVAAGWIVTSTLLCMGTFGWVSSGLLKKLGLKKSWAIALVLCAIGCFSGYFIGDSFTILLIGRVILGIGIALIFTVVGAVIITFYDEKGQEKMNTAVGVCQFLGFFMAALLSVPLLEMVGGSFQKSIGAGGYFALAGAILWMIFGKDGEYVDELGDDAGNVLVSVWKSNQIKLIVISYLLSMISYMGITSFLAYYFNSDFGLDLATAANNSAVMPIAAIVGALLGGVLMTVTGRRISILIISYVFMFIGVLFFLGKTPTLGIIGSGIAGFGSGAVMPPYFMLIMEQKGMDQIKVAAAMALFYAGGFIIPSFAPILVGVIAEISGSFGISFVLTGILVFMALLLCFKINETGSHAKEQGNAAQTVV